MHVIDPDVAQHVIDSCALLLHQNGYPSELWLAEVEVKNAKPILDVLLRGVVCGWLDAFDLNKALPVIDVQG